MTKIYHITSFMDWQHAQEDGEYQPRNFESEEFIHCCTREQLVDVANSFFQGKRGLVLLEIDPGRVAAEIRYEDSYESGQRFPHIYGPIPLPAILEHFDFPAGPDGIFSLPDDL